ncbi:hypothetical protein PSTT_16888 [Puccinia striiformis]|nr:hypothetical protein PSTT_16888 [Puccinia striiformis]
MALLLIIALSTGFTLGAPTPQSISEGGQTCPSTGSCAAHGRKLE